MSKEERKVPELRFKGFYNDWEQRKLNDVLLQMKSGLSRKLSAADIGLPVIRANNIKNGKIDLINDIKYWYIHDPQGAKTSNYLVEKNDILVNFINSESKMGTTAIVLREPVRDTIYTTNIMKLKVNTKEYHSYFIFQQTLTSKYKNYIKIITKPAVNQASFTTVDFKKYNFYIPNYNEQKKISDLLKKLEDLITLHQRKINIWESLKKEYINVILPSKKHDTLKLWFNGYENLWQNNKINKLANRFDNLRIPVSSSDRVPGETPYYGANGIQDYVEGHTHNGEFILIAEDGANSLRNYPVHYVDGTVWVNNHAHVLQGINGIADNRFLMYTFKSINFAPYLVGGSRFKLNADTMMKINIKVPALNEQKKIGKYFSLIDGYINMSHKKIHQLQKIKKLYLSKMFL